MQSQVVGRRFAHSSGHIYLASKLGFCTLNTKEGEKNRSLVTVVVIIVGFGWLTD